MRNKRNSWCQLKSCFRGGASLNNINWWIIHSQTRNMNYENKFWFRGALHFVFQMQIKSHDSHSSFWNTVWDRYYVLQKHGTSVDLLDFPQAFFFNYLCLFDCFRLIGSAKVSLKDLASSQVKSLPVKNLALVDENGKNFGVSVFSIFLTPKSNDTHMYFF